MSTKNLDKIFNPNSIAVVGASNRINSVGYIIFNNLIGKGYNGVVYPVNAKGGSVQGVRACTSIAQISEKVDLVVICTPAKTIEQVITDCGEAGVKGVVIISAGFAEMGDEGVQAMERINAIRKKYDIRIVGPNCLGVIRPSAKMNASFAVNGAHAGRTAFISQSGAIGTAVLDWAITNKIGFSYFVSMGSMLDVNMADMIDFCGADPHTDSIIIYIESIKDARRFMSASRGFSFNKPIIVIKSGRVAEGAKAAASHTGAMAGADDIYDAAFRRAGIVRVNEIADLFNCANTLAKQPRPKGNRLAIITNAGGPGVMATDALIKNGGQLANLSDETMRELNEVLPPYWSRSNPVDILGDADEVRYSDAMRICLKDKHIDGVLVILTPQAMTNSTEIAKRIVQEAKDHKKPILASWMGSSLVEEGKRLLAQFGIPEYGTPEEAVRTFLYMYTYTHNIKLLYETPERVKLTAPKSLQQLKENLETKHYDGQSILSESESKAILEQYGIQTARPILAKTADEAKKIADDMGYPVVLKIESEDISHKSDANCVLLNRRNKSEVEKGFKEILKNGKRYKSDAVINGVSVQPFLDQKAHEVIIGMKKDPQFGSVVLFGMGGIAVEAINDRNIGIPPLNQTLARRLIKGTRVYKLLEKGFRNIPPVDLALVEKTLVQFSSMIVDLPELKEIDINPLRISENSCIALDARMVLDGEYITNPKKRPHGHLIINPYPKEYVKTIHFRNQEITLRPIRPEDEPLWLDMFNSFSEETLRYRFFHVIKEMPHDRIVRYIFNDYSREIAIVPEIEIDGKKKLLGVGRMNGDANHEIAEFAIALRDDWQSKGLGERLFDHMLLIAHKKGWKRLIATTLEGNVKMVNLFRKKGCEIVRNVDEGTFSVTYQIDTD